jgi:hypothetical protein
MMISYTDSPDPSEGNANVVKISEKDNGAISGSSYLCSVPKQPIHTVSSGTGTHPRQVAETMPDDIRIKAVKNLP